MNEDDVYITERQPNRFVLAPPELSRPIKLEEIKDDFPEFTIEASEFECIALAKRFDLIELQNFKAIIIFLNAFSNSTIHISVTFEATFVQRCVVTLDPVPGCVKGAYKCCYSEDFQKDDLEIIEFDQASEDPPEPIIEGEFDAGIVLTEHLGLELNPFPQAPGADFSEVRKATKGKLEDVVSNNPFAVLRNLE